MHFARLATCILGAATFAEAAPAQADSPPELTALFQELRDFHYETGGINTRALYTPSSGK
jgi:hypothetical protein